MSAASAEALGHAALEEVGGRPLASARLNDRQRLAVLLQGSSLLSHLRLAGWRLAAGWAGARIDGGGGLRAVGVAPGPARELPQRQLLELSAVLFRGRRGEVAGRGQARRIARGLVESWRQELVPLPPDEAVTQLLERADFLWEGSFAAARRALAGEHRGRLWVAGPGWFRAPLLDRASSWRDLSRRLAAGSSRRFWRPPGARPRAGRRARARWLVRRGRFDEALSELGRLAGGRQAGAALRIACLVGLGRLGAARRALQEVDSESLGGRARIELAEAAVRLSGALGEPQRATPWLERALAARREPLRSRARLLAAAGAWESGDWPAMERHLEAARPALGQPEQAWRWHHLDSLRRLAVGDAPGAAATLRRGLGRHRRDSITGFEAAALWNDLAIARVHCGELAAAERALLHAVRLEGAASGPVRTTLSLANLAEVRLRRGRVAGVREVLERSLRENRRAGNLPGVAYDRELRARYELLRGRPEAAIEEVDRARAELERHGGPGPRRQLRAVAARAYGWLGRRAAAAEALGAAGDRATEPFEPEEWPALWALAGDRRGALRHLPPGAPGKLWRAALTGRPVADAAWRELDSLGAYRRARTIHDLELTAAGTVPAAELRRATDALRAAGAESLAARLERAGRGPWAAVESYVELPEPEAPEAVGRLFAEAGRTDVRLVWTRGAEEVPIVEGGGGDACLERPLAGGRLRLEAPGIDAVTRALFALVSGHLRPGAGAEPAARGGLVGESQAFVAALARAARLARGELPILITGESGTGKELVARYVHESSRRAALALVPVNCAALAEGLRLSELFGHCRGAFTGADRDRAGVFEAAGGGTVLLDEIGDLPLEAQGLLLRVLQEGEVRRVGETRTRRVDVRVLAATHRDLGRLVADGRFRQDLHFRLDVGRVRLPPLRERGGDVELLARHFLERLGGGRRPRLSPGAATRLRGYGWPGNVRELENRLAAAVALAPDGIVRTRHLDLPAAGPSRAGGYHQLVLDFRRRLLRDALREADGNQAEAARRLGLSRQALSYLVRRLALR